MNDLYKIPTQKIYQGKTGGGWLKEAKVCQTQAGNYEVFVGHLITYLTDDRNMVLSGPGGRVVALTLSSAAERKLASLAKEADVKTVAILD